MFQNCLGKFQKFHYNATKNMELYGSEEAPEYDLSRITAKIHILYGTNDRIASIQVSYFFFWLVYLMIWWMVLIFFFAMSFQNIPLLVDKLGPSLVAISKFPGYNHIDFTYGRSLKKVHKKLLKVLNRFYWLGNSVFLYK